MTLGDMKDHQFSEAGAPVGAPRQRPTSSSRRILAVDDVLLDTVQNVLRVTDSAHEPFKPLPDWRSQPSAVRLWLR
jgi:hypothetical protein